MRTLLLLSICITTLGCGDTPGDARPNRTTRVRPAPQIETISAKIVFPKPWNHGKEGVVGVSFAADIAQYSRPETISCDDFPQGARPQLQVQFLSNGQPLADFKWTAFDKDC